MIEVEGLTKRYGETLAVDDLSFRVQPGQVTGFLGPNGSGKTTTMRMILGLETPDTGRATIDGRAYRDLDSPFCRVGSLVEAKWAHPHRSGGGHLRSIAAAYGIPASRVDEVVALVGLDKALKRPTGKYSLGMGQRLGIAAALLGDPPVVMFDEPVNGLDPEGVVWIRGLCRDLAAEGRTVFISSHLMSEMSKTADHIIVIGQGRLLADMPLEEVIKHDEDAVLVGCAREDQPTLADTLTNAGASVGPRGSSLGVVGMDEVEIGRIALREGIALRRLEPVRATLEQAYLDLTNDAADYASARKGETWAR